VNVDKNLQKYYKEIANKIEEQRLNTNLGSYERYYIHKIKPFFIGLKIYYEVTFTPTNEKFSKSDRMIAFTSIDISKYYAARFWTVIDSINILNRQLPIFIIKKWELAIRPIEIENLGKIFGANLETSATSPEGRGLMLYLQRTRTNLVDLVTSSKDFYDSAKQVSLATYHARTSNIFNVLSVCRKIILNNEPGANVLRYLLLHLNNRVLKLQIQKFYDNRTGWSGNPSLSNLFLDYACIPFDKMPFNSSLKNHNPRLGDLFECIDSKNRQHELFARFIKQNTEQNGILYTPKKDLKNFGDCDQLIKDFNSKIYDKHRPERELRKFHDYVYIYEDQDSTATTLQILKKLDETGLTGYASDINSWLLNSSEANIDDDNKKEALRKMFQNSHVALIYGAAGTGKTTLINYISTFFKDSSRLYLAQTNPAVDNMRRRVISKNSDTTFLTVTKFLKQHYNRTDYDILFVDECSTISNADIEAILKKSNVKLVVLVGDTCQIEAIRFGNWFSLAKKFIPTSVTELEKPFRSSNNDLITFWNKVRNNSDDIQEMDARLEYSTSLDQTIFEKSEKDEIILCLNYDGLYGINNINTLLQKNNPNKAFQYGLKTYKVGDPVLFNDSDRFNSIIYNNLKGWIRNIKPLNHKIQFDIEIDKQLTESDLNENDFELVKDSNISNSIIRFSIDNSKISTEDDDSSVFTSVPFQVAYAVSIHKAQGLEYNSVKIIIIDEVEEQITHCIFYTAITRTKEKLKIYWSPEVEQKIITQLQPSKNLRDFYLLQQAISKK
jgi:Cdc6-like AAA superfamily ATPase